MTIRRVHQAGAGVGFSVASVYDPLLDGVVAESGVTFPHAIVPVPEPSTGALLCLGLSGLAIARLR